MLSELLVLLFVTSVFTQDTNTRPGNCPAPSGHLFLCKQNTNQCRYDSNCPGNLKCCRNKCGGSICTNADNYYYNYDTTNTGTGATSRPGTCPGPLYTHCAFVKIGVNCNDNRDCPGDELCCNSGCGLTCRRPASTRSGSCHILGSLITCPVRTCAADSDCPYGLKCCGLGCCSLPKVFK